MSSREIRRPDGTTAIVHLVRHGEVDNPLRILYGRLPGFHLSEAGRLMAKAAADFLAGRGITMLRSPPLGPAVQTARASPAPRRPPSEIGGARHAPWSQL